MTEAKKDRFFDPWMVLIIAITALLALPLYIWLLGWEDAKSLWPITVIFFGVYLIYVSYAIRKGKQIVREQGPMIHLRVPPELLARIEALPELREAAEDPTSGVDLEWFDEEREDVAHECRYLIEEQLNGR